LHHSEKTTLATDLAVVVAAAEQLVYEIDQEDQDGLLRQRICLFFIKERNLFF
jgi:hypothetical protein